MTRFSKTSSAVILFVFLASALSQAAPEKVGHSFALSGALSEQDRVVIDRFIGHAHAFATDLSDEVVANSLEEKGPERFCWVDFRYLNCLNIAFQLTGDIAHLDLFRKSFSHYEHALSRGEDAYLGWYGRTLEGRQPKENPDLKIDELQTNFRAIGILCTWIEMARRDAIYASERADTINRYLTLIEEHLFPKWDARGHFAVIPGRGGVYRALDFPRTIEVSLSFEKLSIMVDGLIRLHRVTGRDAYLKRALQIGAWFKSHLILKDGHYEWMSWVPAGPWDIHPSKEDSWRVSWMAADPNAAWYVAALSIALNLYQHGLLFDDGDLTRFVRTQREMCWNGDMEHPVYRTVEGTKGEWTRGRFLSYQLSHYDKTLLTLAFAGPHEVQVLKDAESSWNGGANAQGYILEKYIMRPIVEENPQPYATVGEDFLSSESHRVFYSLLNREVSAPGSFPARKPSDLYLMPRATSAQGGLEIR